MLPNILPGWRLKYFADGLGLFPPEGRAHGAIRIRDRRRPLRAARDLLRALIAEMNLPGLEVSPIDRITTTEGEYAAVATISGTIQGTPFERNFGFVFGDDFYTQIDAATMLPGKLAAFRKVTRELAYYYSLGLGELRRRRYYYRPPADWQGYPRGLITEWHPPDFPNHHAAIAVFPARPVADTPGGELDRALHELSWSGFTKTHIDEAEAAISRNKLVGVRWRAVGRYGEGPVIHQDIAVLQDDRFFYVSRLESEADRLVEHRAIFQAFVDSIEPLPHAEAATAIPNELTDQWLD